MRIQFGGPPNAAAGSGDAGAGRTIRQPGRWTSAILAVLAGLIPLGASVSLLAGMNYFLDTAETGGPRSPAEMPWLGMIAVLFLSILAHELLHAVLYPDGGRSDSTVLFLQPAKFQFGVYFEGRIPRSRWIVMRLLPMAVLPAAALLGLFLLAHVMTFALESCLWVLLLTGSLGSGGDLAAVAIVLRQVPPGGVLNFHRGKAYWLPAEGDGF
jgi:hypothetical protein